MGSAGGPYPRFRRALATGNLHIVRAAAAELPRPITLPEALEVLALIARSEPERYPRAAARFAGRAALERDDLELRELALLVAALEHPGQDLPDRICRALNLS